MTTPKVTLRVRKLNEMTGEKRKRRQVTSEEARRASQLPWIQDDVDEIGLIVGPRRTYPHDEVAGEIAEKLVKWNNTRTEYIRWLEQFVPEGAMFNPSWIDESDHR